MQRSSRRLLLLFLAVPAVLVLSALVYMWAMASLEGEQRSFWQSFQWAGETLTTTGYGADARWRHPLTVLFVVSVQLAGVFLVFLIFPIYLIPFLEERFQARLPGVAPKDVSDHALIFRYGPAVETLLAELRRAGVPTLVLETDEAQARRLLERGQPVILAGGDAASLVAAHLQSARALIANGEDDENAALILSARQQGYAGTVLALVEEPYHRRPMMLAGATAVFTPRHILGAALAARASRRINPRIAGVQQLGKNLEVAEVRVHPSSPLAGHTLDETAVGSRTGATVVGAWVGGELVVADGSGLLVHPGGLLVAVGAPESIDRLQDLAEGTVALRRQGHFVVGGGGEVGRKVAELLSTVGEEVLLIDRQDGPEVHLAGDVLDLAVLEKARIKDAQAVILALNTDAATLFATVIAKDLAPEVPVIARVNQAENVERIHRAGADFALSISQVSGQMLAQKLLGEEAFALDTQVKVLRVSPDGLVGHHPATLRIRERTGCSVVAVERGEEVVTSFDQDFRFQSDDAVFVCGAVDAVRRFSDAIRG